MFFLFSNIIPVKGFNRSILYDLQRENYEFIPNNLFDSFKKRKNLFQITTKDKEYFSFLESKDYVLKIDESEIPLFPRLNLDWNYPSIISTVIIHLDALNIKTLSLLSSLLVKNVGIIISDFDHNKLTYINNIIQVENIKKTTIQCFNILILKSKKTNDSLKDSLKQNPFIKEIIYTELTIKEFEKSINITLNNPNLQLFSEAQKHNTYFNRKLFINNKGDFSNTINCSIIFGNIKKISDTTLKKVVLSSKFQTNWHVSKDYIDTCKNCEFRYMCLDNRIPIKRNEKEWYHNEECNYNPYISKWRGEEGYRILAECGVVSEKNGFKINNKKINQINKELWGD